MNVWQNERHGAAATRLRGITRTVKLRGGCTFVRSFGHSTTKTTAEPTTDIEFVLLNSSIFRSFLLPCMWFLSFSSQLTSSCTVKIQTKTGLKNERNHMQGRRNDLNMLLLRSTNYMSVGNRDAKRSWQKSRTTRR